MERVFFSLGALLAGLAVVAGACGAHGGETALAQDQARWIYQGCTIPDVSRSSITGCGLGLHPVAGASSVISDFRMLVFDWCCLFFWQPLLPL